MIIAGRITVNRLPAEVGQKVGPGDEVRVNGKTIPLRFAQPQARVLLYHKPVGEIVSRDDPEGRPSVFANLPPVKGGRWVAVGRLDLNSEGLLLFTTSGELANRLMHPRYELEREYAVRVLGRLDAEQERRLLEGIELEDGPAKVMSIADGGGEGANHWYHVVLTEGRNREVRRLFAALGLQVSRLIRTRFGPIAMPPQLKMGMKADLPGDEMKKLLDLTGIASGSGKRSEERPAGKEGKRGRRGRPGAGRPPSGPGGQRPPQSASGPEERQPGRGEGPAVASDQPAPGNAAPPAGAGSRRRGRRGRRGRRTPNDQQVEGSASAAPERAPAEVGDTD